MRAVDSQRALEEDVLDFDAHARPLDEHLRTDGLAGRDMLLDHPSQDLAPNFVARWRIEQPWGHIQVGAQTILYTLNDGMFLNKQYLGYGGSLSGNFFTGARTI